jgi:hypothetical protein
MSTVLVSNRSLEILHKNEQLLKFTKTLIGRKSLLDSKNLTKYDDLVQSEKYHHKITANLSLMDKSIKQARMEIAREYHARKARGDSSQRLKSLALISNKLQKMSKEIELIRDIYLSPKTPKTNPLAAMLPSVPTHKIIMDKRTLDYFVQTSIHKGWTAAEKSMQQFVALAGPGKFKLSDVKQQVCDELIKRNIANVIGREPEDKSQHSRTNFRR